MELEEKENIVLGKLIGFVNGMDEFSLDRTIQESIIYIIHSLKEKKDLDNCLNMLISLKDKYLPNCVRCASPCGRTDDYYLNKISIPQKKDDRIREYEDFLSSFNDHSDFNDILYHISRLSW